VCNRANEEQIEVLSLVNEQIPRYRLRADSVTDFTGYGHSDIFQATEVIDEDVDLSPGQIGETLKYFEYIFLHLH